MLGESFPFKFNRINVTPFCTISWEQDYAVPGVTNLSWIEKAWMVDINNTSQPKPIFPLEAVRDLERTSYQYGRPGQVCWLPNDQLMYGTWGAAPNNSGQSNPGPNVVYTQPLGALTTPANPISQIKDSNGNLQVLTTFGTCGSTQPTWPAAGAPVGTTTIDGTCIWTVVDPKGQGFRLSPLPPQSGVVYQINVVGQMKPPAFTSFSQTLEPIPDEYAPHFKAGFVAYCYRHSPDPKVRGKFQDEFKLWIASLAKAVRKGDRERDNAGFYPDRSVVESGAYYNIGPAWPYGVY